MSERLKKKIGEDLYNQIIATGIKESEIDLLEGFIPRSRYNKVSEELSATNDKIKAYEEQINETKKLIEQSESFKAENEQFKNQLLELETKFTTEIANKNIEIENVQKKALVKEHLMSNNARHVDLLMGKVQFNDLKIENEKLIGFDDQFEKLKTDYDDMFVKTVNKQEQTTNNNNNNTNGNRNNSWSNYVDNMFK